MKAIQIKYLQVTNFRGARLKVWAESGARIESRDYAIEPSAQAEQMAIEYAREKFNCKVTGFGTLPGGDWVATI